jgi:hypothetical protein
LTVFGDELGVVEIDFFSVITDAAKRGFTRKQIDKAYRAALSNVFNRPAVGRPKGGLEKDKKIAHHLNQLRLLLISDPNKRHFTAANEVLSGVPARERPSSRHLVKKLREDKKGIRALHRLRSLRKLSVVAGELRPNTAGSTALSDFFRLWDDDLIRVLAPYFSKAELLRALEPAQNE